MKTFSTKRVAVFTVSFISLAILSIVILFKYEDYEIGHADEQAEHLLILAESPVDSKNYPEALYHWFQTYRSYDDAHIGETITESLHMFLIKNWSQAGAVFELMQHDHAFHSFVLQHISFGRELESARQLDSFSKTDCPSKYQNVCNAIHLAASAPK